MLVGLPLGLPRGISIENIDPNPRSPRGKVGLQQSDQGACSRFPFDGAAGGLEIQRIGSRNPGVIQAADRGRKSRRAVDVLSLARADAVAERFAAAPPIRGGGRRLAVEYMARVGEKDGHKGPVSGLVTPFDRGAETVEDPAGKRVDTLVAIPETGRAAGGEGPRGVLSPEIALPSRGQVDRTQLPLLEGPLGMLGHPPEGSAAHAGPIQASHFFAQKSGSDHPVHSRLRFMRTTRVHPSTPSVLELRLRTPSVSPLRSACPFPRISGLGTLLGTYRSSSRTWTSLTQICVSPPPIPTRTTSLALGRSAAGTVNSSHCQEGFLRRGTRGETGVQMPPAA